MTDTERTQFMTDEEVLADLRPRHSPSGALAQRTPPARAPRKYLGVTAAQWGETALWLFAIIGFCTTLQIIGQVLHA